MPDPDFAIPTLMPIDSRREDGITCAPPMRQGFDLPGLMVMQHPNAELYATMFECLKFYPLFNSSAFGEAVVTTAAIDFPQFITASSLFIGALPLDYDGDPMSYDGDPVILSSDDLVPPPVVTQV